MATEESLGKVVAIGNTSELATNCSKCSGPIEEELINEYLTGPRDTEWLCANCRKAPPSPPDSTENPAASETAQNKATTAGVETAPSNPIEPVVGTEGASELRKSSDNELVETAKSAVTLRRQTRQFHLDEAETALTAAVEDVVNNLEAEDAGEWKPYGQLRKSLETACQQWQEKLDGALRRERAERQFTANRIRGIAGMKQKTINLAQLQSARNGNGGKGGSAAPVGSRIEIPPPKAVELDSTDLPADIPCSTPGCDGIIPGKSAANWKGHPNGPRGGWKCPKCRFGNGHEPETTKA